MARHQKSHFNHTGEIIPVDRLLGHTEMSTLWMQMGGGGGVSNHFRTWDALEAEKS